MLSSLRPAACSRSSSSIDSNAARATPGLFEARWRANRGTSDALPTKPSVVAARNARAGSKEVRSSSVSAKPRMPRQSLAIQA